jgi:hypothetical protein
MRGYHMDNDDAFAIALLRPLAGEPTSATAADPLRAVREARRRRRHHRVTGTVTASALTAVAVLTGPVAVHTILGSAPEEKTAEHLTSVPPSPTATPSAGLSACAVQILPYDGTRDGGKKAVVTAGDPSGHYLVGRGYRYDGKPYPMLIWKDGVLLTTTELPGEDALLRDVNTKGDAVGSAFVGKQERPFVYHNGKVKSLPGVAPGSAVALNDAGTIVGNRGADHPKPVKWTTADAPPTELPLPPGATSGQAVDIDEDGTVLGQITVGGVDKGYLWLPNGTGRPLPMPTVDGKAADGFWPAALRNGWVAGRAVIDIEAPGTVTAEGKRGQGQAFRPYRYEIATEHLQELPSDVVIPANVSARGWVTGSGRGLAVWAGADPAVALPLPDKDADVQASYPETSSLSDDGMVVGGYWTNPTSDNQPLMWRCR